MRLVTGGHLCCRRAAAALRRPLRLAGRAGGVHPSRGYASCSFHWYGARFEGRGRRPPSRDWPARSPRHERWSQLPPLCTRAGARSRGGCVRRETADGKRRTIRVAVAPRQGRFALPSAPPPSPRGTGTSGPWADQDLGPRPSREERGRGNCNDLTRTRITRAPCRLRAAHGRSPRRRVRRGTRDRLLARALARRRYRWRSRRTAGGNVQPRVAGAADSSRPAAGTEPEDDRRGAAAALAAVRRGPRRDGMAVDRPRICFGHCCHFDAAASANSDRCRLDGAGSCAGMSLALEPLKAAGVDPEKVSGRTNQEEAWSSTASRRP
jgi:hypothetical protein